MGEILNLKLSFGVVFGPSLRGSHDTRIGNADVEGLRLIKQLASASTDTGKRLQISSRRRTRGSLPSHPGQLLPFLDSTL